MSRELRETDPAPPIPGRPEQPTLIDVASREQQPFDVVARPRHYNIHPSGVEAVEICEQLSGNLFNAIKYLFRSAHKGATLLDLKKSAWYFRRELQWLDMDTRGLRTLIERVTSVDDGVLGGALNTILAIEDHRVAALQGALMMVNDEIAKLEKETEGK